jgi:hypothetical protein
MQAGSRLWLVRFPRLRQAAGAARSERSSAGSGPDRQTREQAKPAPCNETAYGPDGGVARGPTDAGSRLGNSGRLRQSWDFD